MMTTSNNQMNSAVDQFFVEDGSFSGFLSDSSFNSDTTKTKCVFNLFRITKTDEKTKDDGSMIRIETGVTLNARVYDNNGLNTLISMVLQSAYSPLYTSTLLATVTGLIATMF